METIELKFILKLLSFEDYRAPLSKLQPDTKTKAAITEKICRQLRDRGLVECTDEVIKLKIAPPGKAVLKLERDRLPISDLEFKALKASEQKKITPAQTRISTAQRQEVIHSLAERGLIEVETKIKQVWLSAKGQQYLRDDCNSTGSATISLNLLNNYLRFLRKFINNTELPAKVNNGVLAEPQQTNVPSDAEILQTIRDLDKQLDTDNYLPIFHLRQKLESVLSREQLDRALYRLQRQEQIDLSSLQEVTAYTQEQIDAGIPQDIGGSLFYITLN